MSERVNDPTFQDYSLGGNNGSGGLLTNAANAGQTTPTQGGGQGYNIAQDADQSLGPVTFTPRDLTDLDNKMNAGWWARQGQQQAQQGHMSNTTGAEPATSTVKSWNDITSGISSQGGFHFSQNGKLYYKQGDQLYHAAPEAGGDYSVSVVPESEARSVVAGEIMSKGESVTAKGAPYRLYNGTVYGVGQREDGTPEVYALSPHEDEYIYNIARTTKTDDGVVAPIIDPIDIFCDIVSGGTTVAARTSGSIATKAWAGVKAGALDGTITAAGQILKDRALEANKSQQ